MKRNDLFVILCIFLLLSVATAGCITIDRPHPSPSKSPSLSPTPSPAPATSNGTAHTLAVRNASNNKYVGAVTDVVVEIEPGSGQVYVNTAPLTGYDYQETARTAVSVAALRARSNPDKQDFKFSVLATERIETVDGPSAGLPMAIAAYSAMTMKPTNHSIYGTGAIESDGTVTAVGGVYFKALAAAQAGARIIIVPSGETVVSTTDLSSSAGGVNLQSELKKQGYNVEVVGVKSFDEALQYYFS